MRQGTPVIRPSIGKSDLTWLVKEWERLVGKVEYPSKRFALDVSYTLVQAFLRGRGIRMGSFQNLDKYGLTQASLITSMYKRVIEDPGKDAWFPTLVKMGFTTFDAITAMLQEHRNRIKGE